MEELKKKVQLERQEIFEEGYNRGYSEYASSQVLINRLNLAREQAVRECLHSKQLDDLILAQSINDQRDGFYKALDYLMKAGHLPEDFNVPAFFEECDTKPLLRDSLIADATPPLADLAWIAPFVEERMEENRVAAEEYWAKKANDVEVPEVVRAEVEQPAEREAEVVRGQGDMGTPAFMETLASISGRPLEPVAEENEVIDAAPISMVITDPTCSNIGAQLGNQVMSEREE